MGTKKVTPVAQARTTPPAQDGSYMAVQGEDGKQEWVLLATDAGDDVTDADMDFDRGKRWAAEQRAKS